MLEIVPEALRIPPVNFNVIKRTAQRLAILFLLAVAGRGEAALTGPTLHLDYGQGEAHDNPIATFMYFVPLISPDHVSVFTDPGNSQCARVLSFTCRTNDTTFRASCEFDFTGNGSQQNVFDLSDKIKMHETDLHSGTVLKHVLTAINISGTGSGIVEIEGTLTNGEQVVNLVRLRFDRHGHTSPVTINLEDIGWNNGAIQVKNELVARVNMLTFERKPGTPKMEVSLASIKRKDAGNGLWQSFWGGLKGVTANLFLPPLTIEREGQQAMLKFGLALATERPEFTFPFAKRLKNPQIAALNRNE
jgi:hypothetical protein